MANTKVTSNVISDDIALGGNPTTTTQSAGNNTTRIATTAFVKAAIDATIDSAPGALDTLNELAAAIGDDANFSTTVTNSIATKLPLAGGTMTGNLTLNGADIVKSGSADLTIDVGGRIDLSADDNGEIRLFDGSSMYAQFKDDSDRLKIQSLISDADMMFVGNDNGSEVTALTLDMSDAGTATFNHDVKLGDDSELVLGDGTDLKFYHSGSVNYIKTNSDLPLKIWDAGGAGILEMTPNGKVGIFHNGSEKIYTTSTGAVIAHNSDTDYSSTGEPAGILTLYNSNGSDGGGVNNYSSLEFNTGDGATSQGFINYVRTADNQGKFTFSQRTGSSSYAEALTILNDGKIGIGTTSPTNHLHLLQDSAVLRVESNGSDTGVGLYLDGNKTSNGAIGDLLFLNAGDTVGMVRVERVGGNNDAADMSFWTQATGGANSRRMTITSIGQAKFGGDVLPSTDSTYDLGSNSERWANIFTGDLHLSNEGSEGNEVDGTSGNWTIQEGEDHLYIKNNKSGKKYRFALEEIE